MKLLFTGEESNRANDEWGANCGPHSLATVLAITLDRARELMPDFEGRGYTTPTMMLAALGRAGVVFTRKTRLKTPELCEGLNRIQWEGRWTKPGVPPIVAYRYTHWVAKAGGMIFCTAVPLPEPLWLPESYWRELVAKVCQAENFDGWHVTHHYAFPSPAKEGA